MNDVSISPEPIDVSKAISAVMRKDCGAVVTFIGTIRDNHKGKPVRSIEVEAYDEMAVKDLQSILAKAKKDHSIGEAKVAHRTGRLTPGEVVVVIAVSATHRADAFDACEEIIDSMKKTTPIWKQEFMDDGGRWVESESG
jgi:molybdopterin synthase catalytic subunit